MPDTHPVVADAALQAAVYLIHHGGGPGARSVGIGVPADPWDAEGGPPGSPNLSRWFSSDILPFGEGAPVREVPASQPGAKPPRDSDKDFKALLRLADEVSTQAKELKELRAEVERLAERTVYSTALTTLASRDYELLRDIPITVERDEDDTSVSWFEIGLIGVDDTYVGALMSFERHLLRLFDDLNAMTDDELGPLPSRWKRTLATVIRRA